MSAVLDWFERWWRAVGAVLYAGLALAFIIDYAKNGPCVQSEPAILVGKRFESSRVESHYAGSVGAGENRHSVYVPVYRPAKYVLIFAGHRQKTGKPCECELEVTPEMFVEAKVRVTW